MIHVLSGATWCVVGALKLAGGSFGPPQSALHVAAGAVECAVGTWLAVRGLKSPWPPRIATVVGLMLLAGGVVLDPVGDSCGCLGVVQTEPAHRIGAALALTLLSIAALTATSEPSAPGRRVEGRPPR